MTTEKESYPDRLRRLQAEYEVAALAYATATKEEARARDVEQELHARVRAEVYGDGSEFNQDPSDPRIKDRVLQNKEVIADRVVVAAAKDRLVDTRAALEIASARLLKVGYD